MIVPENILDKMENEMKIEFYKQINEMKIYEFNHMIK